MVKSVVLIPTYNEIESIGPLLKDLMRIDVDVIVIDDDSPDKTSLFVANLNLPRCLVVNNGRKKGIGAAYLSGLAIALNKGYEKIVTMDADGSHLVVDVERMLAASQVCDVVMGTRWIEGGSVTNWSLHRKTLSRLGTWYARKALVMPYRDLTSGFRIYDTNVLKKLNLSAIRSNGYCFQIEMIRALTTVRANIMEVPINFIERQTGKSKMSKRIAVEAFFRVSLWWLKRLIRYNADKSHYVK